jgi:outer membrane receptor protein involved in Fe transport
MQNQTTQGHGQGYLGALKTLTPELIDGVDVLNGPFSAQYGDFSSLGVVHIRLRESLPDPVTLRLQAGSHDARRAFLAVSPRREGLDSFLAYELSSTNGPFLNPLGYRRDSLTANVTRQAASGATSWGARLNLGRNDFSSSGQIPLDEVAAGRLSRFGAQDADSGGRVRSGTVGLYLRHSVGSSGLLKGDLFATRSLFDLFSNFTFYLADGQQGDEIQQHDSRLQAGGNLQYLRPRTVLGRSGTLVVGAGVHDSHVQVALLPTVARRPTGVTTSAHAHILNPSAYVQQSVQAGRLRAETGLRLDGFRFALRDDLDPSASASRHAWAVQPKLALAFQPVASSSAQLHLNYGRGIASQDARGIARQPHGPRVATTDFWQVGASAQLSRFAVSGDAFLIDRSHEQVYVPDDGSIELAGPSRAYGIEGKASVSLGAHLSANASLSQVLDASYRGPSPRVPVVSAPRTVASTGLVLDGVGGLLGSLRYRHVSGYRLSEDDPGVRAAGHDVIDLALTRRLRPGLSLSLAVDNLLDARYYETQNYFESRLTADGPALFRIHATPGFPRTIVFGLQWELPRR